MPDLVSLNSMNGAEQIAHRYAKELLDAPPDANPLIGAELGVAFGGSLQRLGRLWKPRESIVYGFDTFEGHPKYLATGPGAHEAYCMDGWYKNYGTDAVHLDVIQQAIDADGLDNVKLCAGVLNEHSLDHVPYLHYAMLDLDLVVSMTLAWTLVRPRMVKGGFLCLHDVIPLGHIVGLYGLFQEILATGEYDLVEAAARSFVVVLRRR